MGQGVSGPRGSTGWGGEAGPVGLGNAPGHGLVRGHWHVGEMDADTPISQTARAEAEPSPPPQGLTAAGLRGETEASVPPPGPHSPGATRTPHAERDEASCCPDPCCRLAERSGLCGGRETEPGTGLSGSRSAVPGAGPHGEGGPGKHEKLRGLTPSCVEEPTRPAGAGAPQSGPPATCGKRA